MRQRFVLSGVVLCLVCFAALASSAGAQLPPVKNPLAPAQNPGAAGCSTADASSCAQVAAKLLPIVMGPSPMEENLRRLTDEVGDRVLDLRKRRQDSVGVGRELGQLPVLAREDPQR